MHPLSAKVLVINLHPPLVKTCLKALNLGIGAKSSHRDGGYILSFLGCTQTLGSNPTIGTGQAPCTQLDAPKPPYNQHCNKIAVLPLYGLQYGPSCSATGLAIIKKSIGIAYFKGPTIMSRLSNRALSKKTERLFGCVDSFSDGNKTTFFNFLFVGILAY